MEVYLEKCDSYEKAPERIQNLLIPFSGLFSKNQKIWVKPNLLAPRDPDKAITTHPVVLREVLRFLLALGVKPLVADSPGVGSFSKIAEQCGITAVCEELGVPLVEIKNFVELNGEVFKQLRIADLLQSVDGVINLPKLKTHGQMVMTLGVKNTFGCVVGMNKPAYHMRAKNHLLFADLLIDIYLLVNPMLTILDGIEGMEGNGPSGGTKKTFGVLGVSQNAFALDHAVVKRLKLNPDLVFTLRRAKERKLIPEYHISGTWENTIKLPDTVDIAEIIKLPKWAKEFAHRFAKVPSISSEKCIRCKICEEHCPAQAIDISKQKIDYHKCIRCYVCHELCPKNAILLKRKLF